MSTNKVRLYRRDNIIDFNLPAINDNFPKATETQIGQITDVSFYPIFTHAFPILIKDSTIGGTPYILSINIAGKISIYRYNNSGNVGTGTIVNTSLSYCYICKGNQTV